MTADPRPRQAWSRSRSPTLLYSFGVSHPGAITLHNYPRSLQHFNRPDGELLDLATIDIVRAASEASRATTSSAASST